MAGSEADSWLEWTDELATGDPEIDADQRELFARAQRYRAALGSDTQAAEAGAMLRFFLDVIARHFASEEAMMDAFHYPERENHHQAHQGLLQALGALLIVSRTPVDEAKLPERLDVFLREYLQGHLQAYDLPLARFLAGHRV